MPGESTRRTGSRRTGSPEAGRLIASKFPPGNRSKDNRADDPTRALRVEATPLIHQVVLGIDNLIFISILSNKLPEHQRQRVRRIGIGLALIMRLALLSIIAWLVGLTAIVVDFGITGPLGAHGEPAFETAFSWKDLILLAGGLFLVWKAKK